MNAVIPFKGADTELCRVFSALTLCPSTAQWPLRCPATGTARPSPAHGRRCAESAAGRDSSD